MGAILGFLAQLVQGIILGLLETPAQTKEIRNVETKLDIDVDLDSINDRYKWLRSRR